MTDSTFEDWHNGRITDQEALRSLCGDLGEVESMLQPLESERVNLRDQISHVLDRLGGRAEVAGFGRLELSAPAIVRGYDKRRLDELLDELASEAPEVAARIAACRIESARAGGLRITREKL